MPLEINSQRLKSSCCIIETQLYLLMLLAPLSSEPVVGAAAGRVGLCAAASLYLGLFEATTLTFSCSFSNSWSKTVFFLFVFFNPRGSIECFSPNNASCRESTDFQQPSWSDSQNKVCYSQTLLQTPLVPFKSLRFCWCSPGSSTPHLHTLASVIVSIMDKTWQVVFLLRVHSPHVIHYNPGNRPVGGYCST